MHKIHYRNRIALRQRIGLYGLAVLASLSAALVAATDNKLLAAPGPVAVKPHHIALLLQRECGHVYRVDRSFDKHKWTAVGSRRFDDASLAGYKGCDDTFLDTATVIPKGTKTVYYRYDEITDGKIIKKSEIGTVDMRRWNEYW